MNVKCVKIGGLLFDIVENAHICSQDRVFGQYKPVECKIVLATDVPKQVQQETVIHEILEIINDRLQLEIEHPKLMALGFVLHQVFWDNAALVEEISRR